MGYENAVNEHGQHYVWLDPAVVNRLGAMRGPGESYSDVILRLANATSAGLFRVLKRKCPRCGGGGSLTSCKAAGPQGGEGVRQRF